MATVKYKLAIAVLIITAGALSIAQPARADWLSGWGNRVKLTVDHNDIDSDLSDFPILVYLSASSGRNSDDVTFIFDELGANSKKIAVTKSDGTTECYVEIEQWDNSAEKAWLWTKVSGTNSLSAETDTVLYLYYDNSHADNTTYVGDTNSAAAESVWDGNFIGVWHFPDGTTLSAADSTSNNNDGTISNVAAVSGAVGGAADFPGTDTSSYIIKNPMANFPTTAITTEFWIKTADGSDGSVSYASSGSDNDWLIYNSSSVGIYRGSSASTGVSMNDNSWHCMAAVWQSSGGSVQFYKDGWQPYSGTLGSGTSITANGSLVFGQEQDSVGGGFTSSQAFTGRLDEARVSNTARSAGWIKASYESERDNLLDFSGAEAPGTAVHPVQLKTGVTLRQGVTIKTQ